MSSIKENGECLEWTNGKSSHGYGRLWVDGRAYQTHRLSAHLFNGFDINSKLLVCHKCDNPICINPKHLFIGTHTDNQRDKWRKGRGKPLIGSNNPSAKMDEYTIINIKLDYENGMSRSQIAKKYETSYFNIRDIVTGRSWKHVV